MESGELLKEITSLINYATVLTIAAWFMPVYFILFGMVAGRRMRETEEKPSIEILKERISQDEDNV